MEFLIELNLEFDNYFHFFLLIFIYLSIQVCTACSNDTVEFMRLEELKEPRVREIEGSFGYE